VTHKPLVWYWEMAILMRKVGLAVIAELMQPLGAGLQSTCALVLLASSLLIHQRVAPFQDSMLNKLESSSLFVALVTIAGGAALLDESVGLASKQFVTVILLLCNAVFLTTIALLVKGVVLQAEASDFVGWTASGDDERLSQATLAVRRKASGCPQYAEHSNPCLPATCCVEKVHCCQVLRDHLYPAVPPRPRPVSTKKFLDKFKFTPFCFPSEPERTQKKRYKIAALYITAIHYAFILTAAGFVPTPACLDLAGRHLPPELVVSAAAE